MVSNDSISTAAADDECVSFGGNSGMRYEELPITENLVKGLYLKMPSERFSEIQSAILLLILCKPLKNRIIQAPNGCGKTACFMLSILSRVDPNLHAPQAICICPTGELVNQNMGVLLKIGYYTAVTSEFGLSNYIPVDKRAPMTAQVIIGTPGSINSLIAANKVNTSKLKMVVFDEADLVLTEIGFKEDSMRIMKETIKWSPDCQVLMFSATFNVLLKTSVYETVKDLFPLERVPLFFNVDDPSFDNVKHYKVNVPDEPSKIKVIVEQIMVRDSVVQTIIFAGTRNSARELHKELGVRKYTVTNIEDAPTQDYTDKIQEFKDGRTEVLILIDDYIARGFDNDKVNLIINYDLPNMDHSLDYGVYSHRVGRAGRFGRKGAVFNLICGDMEKNIMKKIEAHSNHIVTEVTYWTNNDHFEDAFKKAGM